MNNIDIEKLESKLTKHFQHNFPTDFKIGINADKNTGEMIVSFFWDKMNQIEFKQIKVFRFNEIDYPKVLETEIKPFALLEKH